MLYRIFLYGTKTVTVDAPAVEHLNMLVSGAEQDAWKRNIGAEHLRAFDTQWVTRRIETLLTDPVNGKCKCRAKVQYPPEPNSRIGWVYIATAYEYAEEVLSVLHSVAYGNDLVLYDAETGRTAYREVANRPFITMRLRQQALQREILRRMNPVWSIRRVDLCIDSKKSSCAYTVTLRKNREESFFVRSARFLSCLRQSLQEGETLFCSDRAYTVSGDRYSIVFVLEGYKKHPDKTGFMKNQAPAAELLHRMGTEEAYRWMQKNCTPGEQNGIFARMRFLEMERAFPNPADRFVESVRITKWEKKQPFDFWYEGIGPYGSSILFHVVPEDDALETVRKYSALKIEEETASFLLPFIVDIYPEFSQRYYLEPNHLSAQTWQRILENLRRGEALLFSDPYGEELRSYVECFNLHIFHRQGQPVPLDTPEKQLQALYANRQHVKRLMDAFIRWSEAQLEHYGDSGVLFNMQGP